MSIYECLAPFNEAMKVVEDQEWAGFAEVTCESAAKKRRPTYYLVANK
jgi:hypothetical protein